MTISILRHIVSFILLAGLQIFILNNVDITGFINPSVFILFLLMLPVNSEIWLCLLAGFISGAIIDGVSGTYGIHAFAGTALGYLRFYYIKYSLDKEDIEKGMTPNLRNMPFGWHLLYLLIGSIFYHWIFFFLEAFTFSGLVMMSTKALMSALLSVGLCILLGFMFSRKSSNV